MDYDSITLEIIANSLQSTADEMFVTMRRAAMSSIIYEVLDMGTGITDSSGALASSGAGIPVFVGVLDKSVKFILRKFDVESIYDGDIFILNDPYHGGVTHLNDIVIAMPIFANLRLIAWSAIIAHNSDVGGMILGSLSGTATELFQEGIRLPPVKLIERGNMVRSLLDVITLNSRMPDFLLGDLWAAIASVRRGRKRILELANRYGVDVFLHAMDKFMEFGRSSSLLGLSKIPHGSFSISEEQDDGRVFNVKIDISKDSFVVDLRDNPDQDVGPTNTSREGTVICAQMLFKSITSPHTPANEGSFEPLKVLTREGSIFHAKEPAALGFYFETEVRVYDLMWRCLATHVPDLLPAGHFASICGTVIGGTHPDTGRTYAVIEPQLGGWGARDGKDGNVCMFSGFHGETYNTPAEISESRNGLIVECMALNDEPGGEGKFVGGRGLRLEYRIRSDNSMLTVGYTRSRIPPWGLNGGNDGSNNYVEVIRKGSDMVESYSFVSGLSLNEGDVVRVLTGSGGGYGDPRERSRESVMDDIRNGYISSDRARIVYDI